MNAKMYGTICLDYSTLFDPQLNEWTWAELTLKPSLGYSALQYTNDRKAGSQRVLQSDMVVQLKCRQISCTLSQQNCSGVSEGTHQQIKKSLWSR